MLRASYWLWGGS